MSGHEIITIRYAIAKDLQPLGANLLTVDTVPIDNQRVLPVCFACHFDYRFRLDPRIVGTMLNKSYIDWANAINQLLNHQNRHSESCHGRIIEEVDHSVILYNAAILFEKHEERP